jgi:hypothetical protein
VDLRVGNEARVAALLIVSYILTLPSGLVMELNNCYYVPAINRNLISISCLVKDGYELCIVNDNLTIGKSSHFYGSARLVNGIYVLNLDNDSISSMYNINTKRIKSNDLNPTYF